MTSLSTMLGKTGPGTNAPANYGALPYGGGIAAFVDPPPPPFAQAVGSKPAKGLPWHKKFIPPLALFNDASQWVNKKYFVRPLPIGQNPDSNPLITAQYFTPPPINAANLGAGKLNLQLQLGNTVNQAQQLTLNASNWFGG